MSEEEKYLAQLTDKNDHVVKLNKIMEKITKEHDKQIQRLENKKKQILVNLPKHNNFSICEQCFLSGDCLTRWALTPVGCKLCKFCQELNDSQDRKDAGF